MGLIVSDEYAAAYEVTRIEAGGCRTGFARQHRRSNIQQDLWNGNERFRTACPQEKDHGSMLARDQRLYSENG